MFVGSFLLGGVARLTYLGVQTVTSPGAAAISHNFVCPAAGTLVIMMSYVRSTNCSFTQFNCDGAAMTNIDNDVGTSGGATRASRIAVAAGTRTITTTLSAAAGDYAIAGFLLNLPSATPLDTGAQTGDGGSALGGPGTLDTALGGLYLGCLVHRNTNSETLSGGISSIDSGVCGGGATARYVIFKHDPTPAATPSAYDITWTGSVATGRCAASWSP